MLYLRDGGWRVTCVKSGISMSWPGMNISFTGEWIILGKLSIEVPFSSFQWRLLFFSPRSGRSEKPGVESLQEVSGFHSPARVLVG